MCPLEWYTLPQRHKTDSNIYLSIPREITESLYFCAGRIYLQLINLSSIHLSIDCKYQHTVPEPDCNLISVVCIGWLQHSSHPIISALGQSKLTKYSQTILCKGNSSPHECRIGTAWFVSWFVNFCKIAIICHVFMESKSVAIWLFTCLTCCQIGNAWCFLKMYIFFVLHY